VTVRDEPMEGKPAALAAILQDSERAGFRLASEPRTGAFLRALAASKPGGHLLELGTGTGAGTAWLLDGMSSSAVLETVDTDSAVVDIARRHLGHDPRVRFHVADGGPWLRDWAGGPFDLIFADAWPGKFHDRDAALERLAPGGLYVIDDLLPQPTWPEGHGSRIEPLLTELEGRPEMVCMRLAWASGLAVVVRRA
jgi:predicted O-methyltransferase YrrM